MGKILRKRVIFPIGFCYSTFPGIWRKDTPCRASYVHSSIFPSASMQLGSRSLSLIIVATIITSCFLLEMPAQF